MKPSQDRLTRVRPAARAAQSAVCADRVIAEPGRHLRQTASERDWPGIEKYIKVAFWGTNVGLAMMVVFSLFPGGVLQVWDVLENGYWHARSLAYTGTTTARTLEWMRMPGDLVFIFLGSVPLAIAAIKAWWGVRRSGHLRDDPKLREARQAAGS